MEHAETPRSVPSPEAYRWISPAENARSLMNTDAQTNRIERTVGLVRFALDHDADLHAIVLCTGRPQKADFEPAENSCP